MRWAARCSVLWLVVYGTTHARIEAAADVEIKWIIHPRCLLWFTFYSVLKTTVISFQWPNIPDWTDRTVRCVLSFNKSLEVEDWLMVGCHDIIGCLEPVSTYFALQEEKKRLDFNIRLRCDIMLSRWCDLNGFEMHCLLTSTSLWAKQSSLLSLRDRAQNPFIKQENKVAPFH